MRFLVILQLDQLNSHAAHSIIPSSAHAAFDKAGKYFGIKVHHIPVDPYTRQVNIKHVRRAMYVVCSVPVAF